MKSKITPNNQEKKLNSEDFIVSKTDGKGIIIYCNEIFIDISGYTEQELIGQQHNIIRHPDMPRTVFQLMWDTIQGGEEFFGYIKNLRKDGGYYWVYANITPRLSKHKGYHSVRRKPSQQGLDTIIPIYTEMLVEEKRVGPKEAIAASTKILHTKMAELGTNYKEFSRAY